MIAQRVAGGVASLPAYGAGANQAFANSVASALAHSMAENMSKDWQTAAEWRAKARERPLECADRLERLAIHLPIDGLTDLTRRLAQECQALAYGFDARLRAMPLHPEVRRRLTEAACVADLADEDVMEGAAMVRFQLDDGTDTPADCVMTSRSEVVVKAVSPLTDQSLPRADLVTTAKKCGELAKALRELEQGTVKDLPPGDTGSKSSGRRSRIPATLNARAIDLLGRCPGMKHENSAQWAARLACSGSRIRNLPAWKAKQSGGASAASKQVTGLSQGPEPSVGSKDEMLKQLIADSEADRKSEAKGARTRRRV